MEIKDYDVMIDRQNVFDQPVKNDLRTYDNMWKNGTGQENDYPAGCLINYFYFNKFYKIIVIDLSK